MRAEGLKENTAHGTNAYPFAGYAWSDSAKGAVDLHWHKETEIIYLKKGEIRLTIDMKECRLKAPALVFVGAEAIHSIEFGEKSEESAVVFDLQMLSFENYDGIQYKIINPLLEKKLLFPQFLSPHDAVWDEVKAAYEHIFNETGKKTLGAYLKIKASMYQLIGSLYEYSCLQDLGEVNAADADRIDVMKSVLTYIRKHYGEKLSVEEIAAIAGMNPQYFCRYFKKMTGKTITNYINDFRIGQAARALADTDEKIIEIAGTCGYDNMGYFIKRFRRSKDLTPSEYRIRMQHLKKSK